MTNNHPGRPRRKLDSSAESGKIPGAVQSAIDFVVAGIASGRFVAGGHLPAIPALSKLAGVSPVTMCRAQAILKKANVLSGHRGQATRVVGPESDKEAEPDSLSAGRQSESPEREDAFRRIHRQVRKDILDGVYAPGEALPLVKQLKSRYRAAAATIRKALMLLCDEKLIVPRRRHYSVARLSSEGSGLRIGVLIQQMSIDAYDLVGGEGHNYLREVELQAAKASVRTMVSAYDWEGDRWVLKEPCRILPPEDCTRISGYILAVSTPSEDFRGICARLALARKPVSVLDLDGGWLPSSPASQPYAVFPVGVSTMSGANVANYLLSLGHRDMAYFSTFHKSRWSQTRYRGIQQACAQAGYPDRLALFSRSQDEWQLLDDASDLPGLSDMSKSPVAFDVLQARKRQYLYLQPLFEKAIADSAITAWIAANDFVAVCAQQFLKAKGISVPERISILSYDDSVTAMTHRVSSYNFNLSGIVSAAFRHILQPRERLRAPRPRTVEIPGAIVERDTTARARV